MASFTSSATVLVPTPGFLIGPTSAIYLNKFIVVAVVAVGAALGECVGYFIGSGIGNISEVKNTKMKRFHKKIERLSKLSKKYNTNVVIFIFALTPLPFDAIGLLCGIIKYDLKKFFIATMLGKLIANLLLIDLFLYVYSLI